MQSSGEKQGEISGQCRKTEENNIMGKTRDLFKKTVDTKAIFYAKIGAIKNRNSKELTEADEIKKMWQEYTEEFGKKTGFNDPDNQDETSLVAQMVKRLPTVHKTWVQSLGWEDPPGEGNGNPFQYSCLENPMDGEAW